jgi:hypothetical protein
MTAPPIFCLVRRCQIVIRSSMPLSDFDPSTPEEQPRRRIARQSIAEARRDCGDVRRQKPRPDWPELYRTGGWPVRIHVASCKNLVPGYRCSGSTAERRRLCGSRRKSPVPRNASEAKSGLAKLRKKAAVSAVRSTSSWSRRPGAEPGEAPLFSRRAAGSAVGARGQSPVTITDDAVAFARCSLQPPAVDHRDRAGAKPDQAFAL